MDDFTVTLTPIDREILKSYSEFCEGLTVYLGKSYEIVLHSLENLEHSAIKVLNGFHTGRTEGAPITNLALSMLSKIKSNDKNEIYSNYFTNNSKGEPMKSTTIPIFGEQKKIIGLLCINFYISTPLSDFLAELTDCNINPVVEQAPMEEIFSSTSKELITQMIYSTRHDVLEDLTIPATNKNKEIIARLYKNGTFNLKSSISECSRLLNISKNTVYLHLRNLHGNNSHPNGNNSTT